MVTDPKLTIERLCGWICYLAVYEEDFLMDLKYCVSLSDGILW